MALMVCLECGRKILSLFRKCPYCGTQVRMGVRAREARVQSIVERARKNPLYKEKLEREHSIFVAGSMMLVLGHVFGLRYNEIRSGSLAELIADPFSHLESALVGEWAALLLMGIFVYLVFRASRLLEQPFWQTGLYCVMAQFSWLFLIVGLLIMNAFDKTIRPLLQNPTPGKVYNPDLAKACISGNLEETEALLKQDADPNTTTGKWYTCRTLLDPTVSNGNAKMVRLLLDHGAVVQPEHISLSRKRGHYNLASLLASKLAEAES